MHFPLQHLEQAKGLLLQAIIIAFFTTDFNLKVQQIQLYLSTLYCLHDKLYEQIKTFQWEIWYEAIKLQHNMRINK